MSKPGETCRIEAYAARVDAFLGWIQTAAKQEARAGWRLVRIREISGVVRPYYDILEAPKSWNWVNDLVVETPLGQVYFHHSKDVKVLRNSQAMGMSFVQSHHHERFDIQYWGNPNALLFGMTIGCLTRTLSQSPMAKTTQKTCNRLCRDH